MRVGSHVHLAGYPKFADGAGLSEERGTVTHERRHFDGSRLILSCRIVSGASGDAVPDSRGRVVAIATEVPTSSLMIRRIPISVRCQLRRCLSCSAG